MLSDKQRKFLFEKKKLQGGGTVSAAKPKLPGVATPDSSSLSESIRGQGKGLFGRK